MPICDIWYFEHVHYRPFFDPSAVWRVAQLKGGVDDGEGVGECIVEGCGRREFVSSLGGEVEGLTDEQTEEERLHTIT